MTTKTPQQIKNEVEKEKIIPFEMKTTDKDGKVDFYLYIKGNKKTTELTINYLQQYLRLIKDKEKIK